MPKKTAKERLTARVAAAPNEKVTKIMAMKDTDARWEALRAAGYCGYGAGSCRADSGKVAPRWKDKKGKIHVECKFHTLRANELNKKYQRKGTTPAWRLALIAALKEAAEDPGWFRDPSALPRRRQLRQLWRQRGRGR